jgi:hypothetical protein
MYGSLDDKKHKKNKKIVSKEQPNIPQNEHSMPKGFTFKKGFYFAVISFIATFILCMFLFVELSHKTSTYHVANNNIDDSAKPASLDKNIMTHKYNHNILSGNSDFILDGKNHINSGDLIFKNGKIYKMNSNGQLELFKGKLKNGMVAYRNGQKMRYENGHWIPVNTNHKAGDFVMKNGKLYRVSSDGSLIPYDGKLKNGDIVWKNGHKMMYENGHLVPFMPLDKGILS